VLGGGTGGIIAATRLRKLLPPAERIVLVDREPNHLFQPSLLWLLDSVDSALSGQTTPNGYYNLERMLRGVIRHGGEVSLCGTCIDARGLTEAGFVDGATRGTMSQLAQWTAEADKVIVF
jgi:uncharacterized protein involved in oxidation of intracellular sulfur